MPGGAAFWRQVQSGECSGAAPAARTLMAVFKRRSPEPKQVVEDATGKGRPTPSRKEAEAARLARVKPPRNSKEAKARDRAKAAEDRGARRAAMMSGDERYLPARDQGPVRAFVRDYVDSRRRIGELVLPGAVIVIFLGFVPAIAPYTYLAFYLILLAVVVDAVMLRLRLSKEVARRFPDEPPRGQTFYALMRSMQIRRLRIPKPRVKIGDPV